MKRVLVTGATGFIGRHCVPLLLARGYEVHAAISREKPQPSATGVVWHQADLLEPHQVTDLVRKVSPSHLLHLAWNVTPGAYTDSRENMAWLRSSLLLFEEFADHGGERLVGAGTCLEYAIEYGYCRESLTPLSPTALYGACKHALQATLCEFAQNAGFSSAWGRVFYLYGPHENASRLVSSVITALLRDEEVALTTGNQVRDYLHVRDVAGAFVEILESETTGAINIGSGDPVSLRDLVSTIGVEMGRSELLKFGALPNRPNEPPLILADVSRLWKEVGFSPTHSLLSGIRDSIQWWRRILQVPG